MDCTTPPAYFAILLARGPPFPLLLMPPFAACGPRYNTSPANGGILRRYHSPLLAPPAFDTPAPTNYGICFRGSAGGQPGFESSPTEATGLAANLDVFGAKALRRQGKAVPTAS